MTKTPKKIRMKKDHEKLFESPTFLGIGDNLIEPRYFGICWFCGRSSVLENPKSPSGYEWVCHYCNRKLDIENLGKKRTLFDIQKQILKRYNEKRNTLGIFK